MKKMILAMMIAAPMIAKPIGFEMCDGTYCVGTTKSSFLVPKTATLFTCGLAGLDGTLTQCQALAAGRTYYITTIVVGTTTTTSGDWAIQQGTGTNCATGTAVVFPAAPATTSSRFKAPISSNPVSVIVLAHPIAVTAANAICVIGTGTNTININISGYYL